MLTQPTLSTLHSFLSSYNMYPAAGHMSAALYALHYIHSLHNYGILFSSKHQSAIHTYLYQLDFSNIEAYDDAIPPSPDRPKLLSTYSNACWGSQVGNAVKA